ncbi:MAG TPA: redoxin domain-containing protein, partial [Candidatus Deferrimicrobium sp.]
MPALMGARLPVFATILALLTISVGAVAAEVEKLPPFPVVHGGERTRFAEPGMIAPDFTVFDVEGHPFRLSEEVSRKPVLLLFWSVFCDPCRAEMATLQ